MKTKSVQLEFVEIEPGVWMNDPDPGNMNQHQVFYLRAATDEEFETYTKELFKLAANSLPMPTDA